MTTAMALGSLALPVVAAQKTPDSTGNDAATVLNSAPNNPITSLQKRLDAGQVALKWNKQHGYLESVLEALRIPRSSQILVFSKTSIQRSAISPQTPRAIYFNDDTYVGYVQGGSEVLEISTVDPKLGAIFYLLNQNIGSRRRFVQVRERCLECHQNFITKGVPGHLIRSSVPQWDGHPILPAGIHVTTDRTPLDERWGGWYVTGNHGKQRHMGNARVLKDDTTNALDTEAGANITDLKPLVDTAPYLTPHSDIVALMVVAHQIEVQNLITYAQYETTAALRYEEAVNKELGRPVTKTLAATNRRIGAAAEPLVRAMLFVGEAQLASPVNGTSGFAGDFSFRGPKDRRGRSLRNLDLNRRLMQYPCSYQIYSPAFDALPRRTKDYIYRRMKEVLSGADKNPDFAHISLADRRAVLEILTDTKPDFAKLTSGKP